VGSPARTAGGPDGEQVIHGYCLKMGPKASFKNL
jgi:hypothetical protein